MVSTKRSRWDDYTDDVVSVRWSSGCRPHVPRHWSLQTACRDFPLNCWWIRAWIRWALESLYQSSRHLMRSASRCCDGTAATVWATRQYHRHCDPSSNTLTLILDTNGTISGGFMPENISKYKGDTSLWNFLFTLINSRSNSATKVALRMEKTK